MKMYINYATVKSLQHFSKYLLFQQLQRLVCCAIFYPHFGQCCTLRKKVNTSGIAWQVQVRITSGKHFSSHGQVGYVLHIYVIFFPVINFILLKVYLNAKFKSKTKKPRIEFVLIAQVHILDTGHYKIYNW